MTTDSTQLMVPGPAYHAEAKIVTARQPAEGWTIGNPAQALRPGELIIGNFARQEQMMMGQAGQATPTPQLG